MYSHQPKRFPAWLIIIVGGMLVFGGYYLWRGMISFAESGSNAPNPATSIADSSYQDQTATSEVIATFSPFNLSFSSTQVPRPCLDFIVTVQRAGIRECPTDICKTVAWPGENTLICVYGPAKNAPDWYEVNISPKDPLPQLGYMRPYVLRAIHPTKRPTYTATPLPTVTTIPATRTPSKAPTTTPNPLATWTPISPIKPSPMPSPAIKQA